MAALPLEAAMHVVPHHTAGRLAASIRAVRRAKVARRLDAVWLVALGHTAAAGRVLLSDRSEETEFGLMPPANAETKKGR